MAWNPLEQPCDYILLAQRKSPGVAELVGASSPRKWDEQQGLGLSGAFILFRGRGLAHFSVKLKLYTPADWAAWDAWRPLLKLPTQRFGRGTAVGALDIWHPLLQPLDIKAVAVEEVMQAEQTDHGEWTIEIKLVEFRRPKLGLAKPEGPAATPADPVEDLIGKLTDQLQLEALASEP